MHDKIDRDEHTGVATTGHEWDGIKELDQPLPRWWLYIFYASIVIAAVMWVLYPAWPGVTSYTHGLLNQSDRADVATDLRELKRSRYDLDGRLLKMSFDAIEADPVINAYALAAGEAAFGDNCATCHGQGGRGAKGYPSLADDVWLWGGTLADIERTIKVGVRTDSAAARFSQMPAFGQAGMLKRDQIEDLTEYVLALSGQNAPRAPVARGATLYHTNCVVCHGADGKGQRSQGAPSLRDQVWLYGGGRQDVYDQIWFGHGGVMPTWEHRLAPETIHALTIYVHQLGGGEPTPATPPTVTLASPPVAQAAVAASTPRARPQQ